jgi:PadR family transcriptional regulator PadR
MTINDMREPTFLILTALAGGKKHGYALIGETEALSSGRVKLKVGSLYASLERLQQEGRVSPAGEEIVSGRLRRYYELTDAGVAALADEVVRLENNVSKAKSQLAARLGVSATGVASTAGALA